MANNSSFNKQGFVIILMLLFLSATVVLVTRLVNKCFLYASFTKNTIDKISAENLAFSGVNIAIAQLLDRREKEDQEEKKEDNLQENFVKGILPYINCWQEYSLDQEKDGVDGKLKIYLSCEDSKLNIDKIYDFKNKKFIGQGQQQGDMRGGCEKFFKQLEKSVGQDLFDVFEKFLKSRDYPINDVTELLIIKKFNKIFGDNVFPVSVEENEKKKPIFLTDLFSIWSEAKINPWFLSEGMCVLFGLDHIKEKRLDKRRQGMQEWFKNFKIDAKWPAEWDTLLMPLYKRKAEVLPSWFFDILSDNFKAATFSVLCCAQVGDVEKRLLAIIQGQQLYQQDDSGEFNIKRFYWL